MIFGFWQGVSGLQAGARYLDALAADISNVNTPGYKHHQVQLVETKEGPLYRADRVFPSPVPDWVRYGGGVGVGAIQRDFSGGPPMATGIDTDLMIQGPGFFALREEGGQVGYTRHGSFRWDGQGRLVDPAGRLLLDDRGNPITLPEKAVKVAIAPGGVVTAWVPKGQGVLEAVTVGRVGVALADAPHALLAADGLYRVPPGRGELPLGPGGEGRRGTVQPGYLEGSNVDLAKAMVDLLLVQRAYSMNARALANADELWSSIQHLMG
ncbi:MAG: flagellar hook basal-body protein [Clostridiales bacterium]|nr:flagellar hook basal-body protein [Clostridiales bacterium]